VERCEGDGRSSVCLFYVWIAVLFPLCFLFHHYLITAGLHSLLHFISKPIGGGGGGGWGWGGVGGSGRAEGLTVWMQNTDAISGTRSNRLFSQAMRRNLKLQPENICTVRRMQGSQSPRRVSDVFYLLV